MLRRFMLPAVAAIALLTGCQTSQIRSFEKVHMGMDKHQVLESVGAPNTTTRMHGKDRWIYRFYDDGIRFDREIHFADGVVIYSGEPVQPSAEKTAAAIDERNAEKEAAFQAEEKARDEARRKNADLFRDYEARHESGKVKYLPEFTDLK